MNGIGIGASPIDGSLIGGIGSMGAGKLDSVSSDGSDSISGSVSSNGVGGVREGQRSGIENPTDAPGRTEAWGLRPCDVPAAGGDAS
jgi:hypothetical protein